MQDVDARAAGMAGMTVQAVLQTAVAAVLPDVGLLQNTIVSIPRRACENLGQLLRVLA